MAALRDFVCDSHASCADCKCGKVWFTHEDDEYETLQQKADTEPDKYVESDDDGVGYGWISGEQVVWNCDCGFVVQHEAWIRNHEEVIRKFLQALGAERVVEANRMAAIV